MKRLSAFTLAEGATHVNGQPNQRWQAFTLAEVLIAKRDSEKISLLNLFRTRELKAPLRRCLKQCAFTLAEVLITLGIIGVVAAMTIPTLINGINDVQYKTAYKKAFSVASQAVQKAKADDLFLSTTANTDANHVTNFLTFKDQFKVVKECLGGDNTGCWASGEKDVNGAPSNNTLAFIDASGVAWNRGYLTSAVIIVDTNGFKSPNRWGKDRFYWYLITDTDAVMGQSGTPVKIRPLLDNDPGICFGSNICATKQDYFGNGWLYN